MASSVSGTSSSKNSTPVFETDPNIKKLGKAANHAEDALQTEMNKLDNANLSEKDKQEVLFKIQQIQNFIERIYALMSNLIESSHRTMMGIINKISA